MDLNLTSVILLFLIAILLISLLVVGVVCMMQLKSILKHLDEMRR